MLYKHSFKTGPFPVQPKPLNDVKICNIMVYSNSSCYLVSVEVDSLDTFSIMDCIWHNF